jgi:hypothetical protein
MPEEQATGESETAPSRPGPGGAARGRATVKAGAAAIVAGSIVALPAGLKVVPQLSLAVTEGPTSPRVDPGSAYLMALGVCVAFAGVMMLVNLAVDRAPTDRPRGSLLLAAAVGVIFSVLSLGVGLAYMGSPDGNRRVFGRQLVVWAAAAVLAWMVWLVVVWLPYVYRGPDGYY